MIEVRRPIVVLLLVAAVVMTGCRSSRDMRTGPNDDRGDRPIRRADAEPDRLSAEEVALNVESFDVAWELVGQYHYDPDLNGVDWVAVRNELRPQVAEATTMSEARSVIRDMLSRLGESHYGIIPGDVYRIPLDDDRETLVGEPGDDGSEPPMDDMNGVGVPPFKVTVTGGKALVRRVFLNANIDDRVRPGVEIAWVDDIDVREVVAAMQQELQGKIGSDFAVSSAVEGLLIGKRGSTVDVTFETLDGETFDVAVNRQKPPGEEVAIGNLPPFPLEMESRSIDTLAGPVEYVRFNVFFSPPKVIPLMRDAVRQAVAKNAAGFIIDLRGNPGGFGGLGMGLAGFFVDEPNQKLGTMTQRGTELNFVVNPRQPNYDGPLAILIDGGSMSTSEIFAQGLKDLGRAELFGTTTGGAALPSVIVTLPNGDRLQYALADYVSDAGRRLEGNGVLPDTNVMQDRQSLIEGRDPVLDAATDWIVEQQRKKRDQNPANRQAA